MKVTPDLFFFVKKVYIMPGTASPKRAAKRMPRQRDDLPIGSSDIQVRFAQRLRELMAKKNWTTTDVSDRLKAADLDIEPRSVEVWIRGTSMPKAKDLETVGTALGFKDYRNLLPPPLK